MKKIFAAAAAIVGLSAAAASAQMSGGQGGGMMSGGWGWGMNTGWLFLVVIPILVILWVVFMMKRK